LSVASTTSTVTLSPIAALTLVGLIDRLVTVETSAGEVGLGVGSAAVARGVAVGGGVETVGS
jgi:hypothetical protein